MRHDKEGEELSRGLWLFRPGERVVAESSHVPAAPRKHERGNGPLDDPFPPLRRQVGRRILQGGPGVRS
jgi:hypothetical protein